MASNPQGQLRATTVSRERERFSNSPVNYQVTRDLLSVQFNPPGRPRLVTIPAKAIVQMKSTASDSGFIEVHWENRIHKIFEADFARLTVYRNGVK